MNKTRLTMAAVCATALLVGGPALADTESIRTMANIAMNLNHFPSDDDKSVLKGIIDSDTSSEAEASIAMALSNLQHKVGDADAERLQEILDDESEDDAARQLAGIVMGINHSASEADKATLAALAAM